MADFGAELFQLYTFYFILFLVDIHCLLNSVYDYVFYYFIYSEEYLK